MQQDNNDIENKLRQLENQQLPDLSNMDKHWQATQQLLKDSESPSEKNSVFKQHAKKLLLAASVVIMALLAGWLYKYSRDAKMMK